MSHVFSSIGKVLKAVAPVALPIAASFIPGIGPLGMALAGGAGGALGGGGLKGALLGGLTSGIGGGMFGAAPGTSGIGVLDSLNKGIFGALNPIGNSITSALSPLGNLFGGGSGAAGSAAADVGAGAAGLSGGAGSAPLSAFSPSGGGDLFSSAFKGAYGDPTSLTSSISNAGSAGALGGASSGGGGILGSSPLSTIAKLASIVQMVGGGGENFKGAVTQQQTQDQIAAQRAAQQNLNKGFISSLNAGEGTPYRTQTNPNTDYYTYGQRPGESFFTNPSAIHFNDPQNSPLQSLKAGGLPKNSGQADNVKANLSEGEYVVPADAVSALGDGNTEGGGKQLDGMVKNIRKKRNSAGTKLPKASKSPLAYMGAV